MSPHAALRTLLLDLFTPDALQRFITDSTPLRHEIAWSGPPVAVANSVADTLKRHGYLDAAFFQALRDERPKQEQAVMAVAAQFGVTLPAKAAVAPQVGPRAGESHPFGVPSAPEPRQPARRWDADAKSAPTPPPPPTTPVPVFIYYSHADTPWVERLALNLHNAGLEVLIDYWLLAPGDNWVEKLTEGLDRCQCALIVVSEASMASPWVQSEMTTLLSHAVSQKKRVVGVRLGDAPIPTMLANYQWIDFRLGDADGKVFRSLVDALQGRRPGPPPRTDDFHRL